MDELDRASELEQQQRDELIAAARRRAPHPAGNGICMDCREAVEPERQGAARCISCQQDEDKRQKQRYGKRR